MWDTTWEKTRGRTGALRARWAVMLILTWQWPFLCSDEFPSLFLFSKENAEEKTSQTCQHEAAYAEENLATLSATLALFGGLCLAAEFLRCLLMISLCKVQTPLPCSSQWKSSIFYFYFFGQGLNEPFCNIYFSPLYNSL